MPRRTPRPRRPSAPEPTSNPTAAPPTVPEPADDFEAALVRLGEWLRRAALGLTAALVVARASWPGEAHGEADSGQGLGWSLGLLLAAALAIFGTFFAGRLRFRFSWADLAVYLLIALVALSARQGAEPRVAINLAWEWVGVGLAYLLIRQLPRSDGEASALAGALAATAVAVSAFGIYQVAVVQPQSRAFYRSDPERALRVAGVPDEPVARKAYEDRLLGSTEPTGPFALANSLAGFLLGPAVLGLAAIVAALADRKRPGGVLAAVLAVPPWLLVLGCLVLTKSRSAYLGFAVGAVVPAWDLRRRVPARVAIVAGLGLVGLVALVAVVAVATGQLDPLVLSESTKSLRYRWEYWVGTWRLIWAEPGLWWSGVGPGNFGGPYLRHKLPEASESISDPHNLLLEAWATAGLPALLALIAALGLGLRAVLGTPRPATTPEPRDRRRDRPDPPDDDFPPEPSPPARSGWLIACAGVGGPVLAMLFRPDLAGDLLRWAVLVGAWAWAMAMGIPLWARRPPLAAGIGAGVLAIAVNLLAAGGLGFAPVALMLWGLLAIGQDLRSDRPCGRLRVRGSRGDAILATFALSAAWAGLVGVFVGTAWPHFAAELAMARGESTLERAGAAYEEALLRQPRGRSAPERAEAAFQSAQPLFQRADEDFKRAAQADPLAARPWLARARLYFDSWRARGAPTEPGVWAWHEIRGPLKLAEARPRNPNSLAVELARVELASRLLARPGWPEVESRTIEDDLLDALRRAVRFDPTDPGLRARLSDALAAGRRQTQAAEQAREALRLDRLLERHPEKRLRGDVRRRLQARANAGGGS